MDDTHTNNHTWTHTNTDSLRHTISYSFTSFGKQEAVVLGNQSLYQNVWPLINPTSNTPQPAALRQDQPLKHPQVANMHSHSIHFTSYISLFTQTA